MNRSQDYDFSDGAEAIIEVLDVMIGLALEEKHRAEIRLSERDLHIIRNRINLLINILETTKCTA